jgi:hypothetical protein
MKTPIGGTGPDAMTGGGDMARCIEIGCPFCSECKTVAFTAQGFQVGAAAYIAHMVESHWDKLEEGRALRVAAGVPVNDAWTRI